jgi:Zn-dependent protease
MESFDLFFLIALIFSIIIHEVSHGYAAAMLGDPTARLQGRLTLNPLPHIDPIGSVLLPALLVLTHAPFLFGWAKPVPYNPYNLKNQRWGEALVAGAGPGVNILLALMFGVVVRFGIGTLSPTFISLAALIVYINILLAFFTVLILNRKTCSEINKCESTHSKGSSIDKSCLVCSALLVDFTS